MVGDLADREDASGALCMAKVQGSPVASTASFTAVNASVQVDKIFL